MNIISAKIDTQNKNYIIPTILSESNADYKKSILGILILLQKFDLNFKQIMLLLSESASYMVKAFDEFKKQKKRNNFFFNAIYLAQLAHNCGKKVKEIMLLKRYDYCL